MAFLLLVGSGYLKFAGFAKFDGRLFVECVKDGKGEIKTGARCMCQEGPNSESVAGSLLLTWLRRDMMLCLQSTKNSGRIRRFYRRNG